MFFILIFKSRLVFIYSEHVFLSVKSIFSVSVIISSVFNLKNIILLLLLLSKLLSNSEIFLCICAGSILIDSECLPNSDLTTSPAFHYHVYHLVLN